MVSSACLPIANLSAKVKYPVEELSPHPCYANISCRLYQCILDANKRTNQLYLTVKRRKNPIELILQDALYKYLVQVN